MKIKIDARRCTSYILSLNWETKLKTMKKLKYYFYYISERIISGICTLLQNSLNSMKMYNTVKRACFKQVEGHWTQKKKNCKPYKWHNMINLFADKANNIFHCRFSKLKFISTCRCSFLYREAIKGPLWIKIVIEYFLVKIN